MKKKKEKTLRPEFVAELKEIRNGKHYGFRNMQEFEKLVEERNRDLKKTGIPKCIRCGTPMINAVDSITKKISKYIWKHNCKCSKAQLMMG